MTIRIDDNVPLPQDSWISATRGQIQDGGKLSPGDDAAWSKLAAPTSAAKRKPAVLIESNPTADNWVKSAFLDSEVTQCTLIGGPLNGQRGPIKGEARIVELELYGLGGEVTSIELYALGDKPTPTFRYHVGSKAL